MPRGKKKIAYEPVIVPDEAAKEMVEKIESFCNHRNMHYTAGELKCVLPKKHGGDHFGYVNGNPTAWSDAAGTPTRKHA